MTRAETWNLAVFARITHEQGIDSLQNRLERLTTWDLGGQSHGLHDVVITWFDRALQSRIGSSSVEIPAEKMD